MLVSRIPGYHNLCSPDLTCDRRRVHQLLKVMLLEMPDFSYSFGGLANAADLPGLNVTIKAALDKVAKANVDKMFELNHYKVIRQTLVWPNRLSYQFPFDEALYSL